MIKFLEKIIDSVGNKYLAVTFHKREISDYLSDLNNYLGDDEFHTVVSNQQHRDLNNNKVGSNTHTHHMTVLNVIYTSKSIKSLGHKEFNNKLDNIMSEPMNINMFGVGTVIDSMKNNQTFFIVCKSTEVDNFRISLGLKPVDLHITIGFDKKDVFGVSKGEDSLINLHK